MNCIELSQQADRIASSFSKLDLAKLVLALKSNRESLQHAVLVDGIHGHVRVSLTNCDVFGCIHENGCGVSVRHGAFCEIGHRTRVRECHTGIKVDPCSAVTVCNK